MPKGKGKRTSASQPRTFELSIRMTISPNGRDPTEVDAIRIASDALDRARRYGTGIDVCLDGHRIMRVEEGSE